MMNLKLRLLPLLVAAAGCGLVAWTALGPLVDWPFANAGAGADESHVADGLSAAVDRVNRHVEGRWTAEGIPPAEPADELQVLRRLSLALVGTIPSLEDIRQFEADDRPSRLDRWTSRMLADDRFGEYFAERLGVALLGERQNEHPMFRRERFVSWLGGELVRGRPFDEIARQIIAETGSPTSAPATNFVTAQITQDDQFANRLASRTVRAFLGQRIDCAECHDHPFDDWKQADFQGLAAYFAQARFRTSGLEDDDDQRLEVEDRSTLAKRVVEPRVPFHDDWVHGDKSRRRQLADWVTHRENRRFTRAIANRVWGLMFGRPFVTPIDDIPDPPETPETDETAVLDVLAADLQAHDVDLRRTITVIALSRPFRLASTHPSLTSLAPDTSRATVDSDSDKADAADEPSNPPATTWAMFPLIQLRPEQIFRAYQQTASIQPMHGTNVISRSDRLIKQNRFFNEFSLIGENEFEERFAAVPQTVLHMTSRATREAIAAKPFSVAGRIAVMAQDDASCLDACFLVCLTRRPTEEEKSHFLPQLVRSRRNRTRAVEDILWSLINSPEFLWNH